MIFSVGIFAILAQTLIFRDFLNIFSGNELSIGIFFLSWLIWVVIGAVCGGTAYKSKIFRNILSETAYPCLSLLYIPLFLFQKYLIINSRIFAGVDQYELFPIFKMIPAAFITNAPISLLTGLLFVLGSKWFEGNKIPPVKVYLAESLGSFIGAVSVTVLLYMQTADSSVFVIASIFLISTVSFVSSNIYLKKRKYSSLAKIVLILLNILIISFSIFLRPDKYIRRLDNIKKWNQIIPSGSELKGSFNTLKAEYIYGKFQDKFIVISNNSVIESYPSNNEAALKTAENLAQCPNAENILLIGSSDLSTAETLAGLPQVKEITLLSEDADYYKNIYPLIKSAGFCSQKTDSKVNMVSENIFKYIDSAENRYDLIIIDLAPPTTLALNKFYTDTFISELKKRLRKNGVISFYFDSGENFMGSELKFQGASLMHSISESFSYRALKPGERSCFFASNQAEKLTENADNLQRRLEDIKGIKKIFPPSAITSLFPQNRIENNLKTYLYVYKKYPKLTNNTDTDPKSYLYSIIFTAKKAGIAFFSSLQSIQSANKVILPFILSFLILAAGIRLIYIKKFSNKKKKKKYCSTDLFISVFLASFAAMLTHILLIYQFQNSFGTVFIFFGLISAFFMLGLFLGAVLFNIFITKINNIEKLCSLPTILNFSLLILLLLTIPPASLLYYAFLFIATGFIGASYFALSSALAEKERIKLSSAASFLDCADHLGGATAGIAGSFLLIPFGGIYKTLYFIVCVILIRHFILLVSPFYHRKKRLYFEPAYSILKYTALLFIIMFSVFLVINDQKDGRENISRTAQIKAEKSTTESSANKNLNTFESKNYAANIIGYGGPSNIEITVDKNGKLIDFKILESNETPVYLKEVLQNKERFSGKNLLQKDIREKIQAVSGATISSNSIKEILIKSTRRYFETQKKKNENIKKSPELPSGEIPQSSQIKSDKGASPEEIWHFCIIALTTAAVIIFSRYTAGKKSRIFILLFSVSVLGFYLNFQYSTVQIESLLKGNINIHFLSSAFAMLVFIPVAVFLFFNFYCGFFCPFGALQELMTIIGEKLPLQRFIPDRRLWKIFSIIKFFLLILIILNFSGLYLHNNMDIDILKDFFFKLHKSELFTAACFFIIISAVFPRFWCRIFCPAGAFLSLLRLISPFKFLKKNKICPAKCSSGISEGGDSECLECMRCQNPENINLPYTEKLQINRQNIFFISAVICGFILLFSSKYKAENKTELKTGQVTHKDTEITGKTQKTRANRSSAKKISEKAFSEQKEDKPGEKQQKAVKKDIQKNISEENKKIKAPPGKTFIIDREKYIELINEGKLSDREALFYKKEK